jgi:hypothetical protein
LELLKDGFILQRSIISHSFCVFSDNTIKEVVLKKVLIAFGIIFFSILAQAQAHDNEDPIGECSSSCQGHQLEMELTLTSVGGYSRIIYEPRKFVIKQKGGTSLEEYQIRLCSIVDNVRPMYRVCDGVKNGTTFILTTPHQFSQDYANPQPALKSYQVKLQKGAYPYCSNEDILFSCKERMSQNSKVLVRQFSNAVCAQNASEMYKLLISDKLKNLDLPSLGEESWIDCAMNSYLQNPLLLDQILQQSKMRGAGFITKAAWNKIFSNIFSRNNSVDSDPQSLKIGQGLIELAKEQGFSEKDFEFNFEIFISNFSYLNNVLKEFPKTNLNTLKANSYNLITAVMVRLFHYVQYKYNSGKEETEQLALKLISDPNVSLTSSMPKHALYEGAPLVFLATGSEKVMEALSRRENITEYANAEDNEGRTIADYIATAHLGEMDFSQNQSDWDVLLKYLPQAKLKNWRGHPDSFNGTPYCKKQNPPTLLQWLNCQGIYTKKQAEAACMSGDMNLIKRVVPLNADPTPLIYSQRIFTMNGKRMPTVLWHYVLANKSPLGSIRILEQLLEYARQSTYRSIQWDILAADLKDVLEARKDIDLHTPQLNSPFFRSYNHDAIYSDLRELKDRKTNSYGGGIFYILYYAIKNGHPELVDVVNAHRSSMDLSSKTTWNNEIEWSRKNDNFQTEFVPSITELLKDPKLENRWQVHR